MDYELAKALRDAGFPQHHLKYDKDGFCKTCPRTGVCEPTLEELITEIGGKRVIIWEENGWYATVYDAKHSYVSGNCIDATFYEAQQGATPVIAAANLWLTRNKK